MDQEHGDVPSMALSHYGTALVRRWHIPVLGAVAGLLLAALATFVLPTSYTATAVVKANVITSAPFSQQRANSELLDPQTEVEFARATEVMQAAVDALGDDITTQQVRSNTQATLAPDATVMTIRYSDDSAEDAEVGVDAIATGYLELRSADAQSKVDSIVSELSQHRDNLRADLTTANNTITNAPPGSSRASQARISRELINTELGTVIAQINSYQSVDTQGGRVLQGAGDQPVVVSPPTRTVVLLGLVAGFALGVIWVLFTTRRVRVVSDAYDLHRAGGGEVLAVLPSTDAEVPGVIEDRDAFRSLREWILARPDGHRSILIVVDLTGGAGVDVAPNLLGALAETGHGAHLMLPGASDELTEQIVDGLGMEEDDWDGTGRTFRTGTVSMTTWADAEAATEALTWAPTVTDQDAMVLVGLPPQADRWWHLATSRLGGSVLLVVESGRTTAAEIREVAKDLEGVRADILGAVVVPAGRSLATPVAK